MMLSRFQLRAALWVGGFALNTIVLVLLTVGWVGSGQPQMPALMLPLLMGTIGMLVGLCFSGLTRLILWLPSWGAIAYTAVELVKIQLQDNRGVPGMYLMVYVGLTLLTVAALWRLKARSAE